MIKRRLFIDVEAEECEQGRPSPLYDLFAVDKRLRKLLAESGWTVKRQGVIHMDDDGNEIGSAVHEDVTQEDIENAVQSALDRLHGRESQ